MLDENGKISGVTVSSPAGEYTIHAIAILGGESYNVQKTVTVE